MNVKRNQWILMISEAYLTVILYAVTIGFLVYSRKAYNLIPSILWIFGLGAFLSILSSTIIIRKQLIEEPPFVKTFVHLVIAHLPAVTSLVVSFTLFM